MDDLRRIIIFDDGSQLVIIGESGFGNVWGQLFGIDSSSGATGTGQVRRGMIVSPRDFRKFYECNPDERVFRSDGTLWRIVSWRNEIAVPLGQYLCCHFTNEMSEAWAKKNA